jgi:hypothetical protein
MTVEACAEKGSSSSKQLLGLIVMLHSVVNEVGDEDSHLPRRRDSDDSTRDGWGLTGISGSRCDGRRGNEGPSDLTVHHPSKGRQGFSALDPKLLVRSHRSTVGTHRVVPSRAQY